MPAAWLVNGRRVFEPVSIESFIVGEVMNNYCMGLTRMRLLGWQKYWESGGKVTIKKNTKVVSGKDSWKHHLGGMGSYI